MGEVGGSGEFGPERFVAAQDEGDTFDQALTELRAGRKRTHWMWFVFPQVAGLGSSPMAVRFALGSIGDAADYLGHPVLGDRLRTATDALLRLEPGTGTADEILGPVDAMKLQSSMTLFAMADPGDPRFAQVLDRYFDGIPDLRTERLIDPTGRGHFL